VLGLPEDVLSGNARVWAGAPVPPARASANEDDVKRCAAALSAADRPLMIVGGPGWSGKTAAAVEAFALRFDMPVATAFRCQDYLDNRHPCYVGHAGLATEPKLAAAMREADLLVALGTRLDEITTGGYALLEATAHRPRLVHVSPDAGGLGRVFPVDVPVVATSESFAVRLAALSAPAHRPWADLRRDLRAAFEQWSTPVPGPGEVQLGEVIRTLSEVLPEDAIVTNGAGNYAAFLHRHFCYKRYGTQLAPASGSMGYGLPAAIAAKLARPEHAVVALAGDGCFTMTAQELATAVQYGLAVTVIVVDNGMYGTIRMHQERAYPGRVIGTSLVNPDFAAFARSFGAQGETVTRTQEFAPALERALAAGGPALIHVKVDADAIAPGRSLSEMAGRAVRGPDVTSIEQG
jgi:acetolactate synthase-1/2/3 large subunit